MQFYSIIISILHRFPPGKWVPLGQTMEGGSKKSDLFTGVHWPLIHILLINASIIYDTALSNYLGWKTCIEGWLLANASHLSKNNTK